LNASKIINRSLLFSLILVKPEIFKGKYDKIMPPVLGNRRLIESAID
jgi:hypothetical protein